jgi:hypothetical protein
LPGWVPAYEEISFNQKCFKRNEEWVPKLSRFQCVLPVAIVVGGWGIDTENGFSTMLSLDFPNELFGFQDANLDLISPKVLLTFFLEFTNQTARIPGLI